MTSTTRLLDSNSLTSRPKNHCCIGTGATTTITYGWFGVCGMEFGIICGTEFGMCYMMFGMKSGIICGIIAC